MFKNWFAKEISIGLTAEGFVSTVRYKLVYLNGVGVCFKRMRHFTTYRENADVRAEQLTPVRHISELRAASSRSGVPMPNQ